MIVHFVFVVVVYFPNCNRHTAHIYIFRGVQFVVIPSEQYSCDLWSEYDKQAIRYIGDGSQWKFVNGKWSQKVHLTETLQQASNCWQLFHWISVWLQCRLHGSVHSFQYVRWSHCYTTINKPWCLAAPPLITFLNTYSRVISRGTLCNLLWSHFYTCDTIISRGAL